MAGTDSKADALAGTVKDHVEALHDNGAHDSACGGLGDGKLVAVVLRGGHVLHRAQVLLPEERCCQERGWGRAPRGGQLSAPTRHDPVHATSSGPLSTGQGLQGPALTWGRMVILKDWLVASPIR